MLCFLTHEFDRNWTWLLSDPTTYKSTNAQTVYNNPALATFQLVFVLICLECSVEGGSLSKGRHCCLTANCVKLT